MKSLPFILLLFFLVSLNTKKDEPYEGFTLKDFEKSLCYIPQGSFITGNYDYDRLPDPNNPYRVVNVYAFYMMNHEVTNGEYLEFLNDVRQNDSTFYRSMLPDTNCWSEPLLYTEPYIEWYLRHPYYSNFPIVGISHEQATEYCKWLTKKYATFENRRFKSAEFKLPSETQWEYATRGDLGQSPFPWGNDLMDENGKPRANFCVISQEDIMSVELRVKDRIYDTLVDQDYLIATYSHYYNGDVIMNVISFLPNGYNLYNMAGNVEEMVAEYGITKGGSWFDTGYHLQNSVKEWYDSTSATSAQRGFRVMMELKE